MALACPRAITGILEQVTGSETREPRALQQMTDKCSAERGSRGRPRPRTCVPPPPFPMDLLRITANPSRGPSKHRTCEYCDGPSPGPQGSPGLLRRRRPAQAPASVRTRPPRPGPAPTPRPPGAVAPALSRGPSRRAAGLLPRPACAAAPHSPVGGAAAAPAAGGGAKGEVGGASMGGVGNGLTPFAPPRPHRLGLLAPLQQVSVVRAELVPLAVGDLLELPQESALL